MVNKPLWFDPGTRSLMAMPGKRYHISYQQDVDYLLEMNLFSLHHIYNKI